MRIDIGDGVRLYVDIDGAGLVPEGPAMVQRPTLLLLHGGPGMDHSLFKGSPLSELADVAQVVYYDHRGQGRSDPRPADEWNLDTWADDVVRLCDALGVEKPIVVGTSFGGFVAQHYLARHPDHAAKVVLACTSPRMSTDIVGDAFERFGGAAAGDAARRFFAGDLEALADYMVHCLPLYSARGESDLEVMARIVMNLELQTHFMSGEAMTMDLAPGLGRATCPVLVVCGEIDPVCPVAMSDEIVAALPPELTTYVEVPGASHMDVIESADIVRDFIAAPAPV